MSFKVGDKVRHPSGFPWETGMVVTIRKGDCVEVLPDNGYRFPSGCARFPGAGTYGSAQLQYVPSQDFKLERGDQIRNNRTGRLGHVVTGQDNRLWVVDDSYSEETGAPASAVEEYEEHYAGTYEITNRGPF